MKSPDFPVYRFHDLLSGLTANWCVEIGGGTNRTPTFYRLTRKTD